MSCKDMNKSDFKVVERVNIHNLLYLIPLANGKRIIDIGFPSNTAIIKGGIMNFSFLHFKPKSNTIENVKELIKTLEGADMTLSLQKKYLARPFRIIKSVQLEKQGAEFKITSIFSDNECISKDVTELIPFYKNINFTEFKLLKILDEFESTHCKSKAILKNAISPFEARLKELKSSYELENGKFTIQNKVFSKIGHLNIKSLLEFKNETVFMLIRIIDLKEDLLKKFNFKKMNNSHQGIFFIEGKDIIFKTAMHFSIDIDQNNNSLIFLKSYILDTILPRLDALYHNFQNPREHTTDQLLSVTLQLTNEQFCYEEELKRVLSGVEKKTSFFNSRLNVHKIQLRRNLGTAVYFFPNFSETFDIFGQDYFNTLFEGLLELRDMLSELKIFFKLEKFSLDLFNWFNEKPVFIYRNALCETFEIKNDVKISEYNKIFSDIIRDQIYNFHRSKFILRENPGCLKFFDFNSDFIQIGENYANDRLRLYKNNKFFRIRQYSKILKINMNEYLVAEKTFSQISLEGLSQQECIKIFEKLLIVLKEFSVKNTFAPSFDYTCLGEDRSNNLLLDLKSPDEIDQRFKSPELLSGRSSSRSSVYCFGKLLEFILLPKLPQEKKMKLHPLIHDCTESNIIKRRKLEDISIDSVLN